MGKKMELRQAISLTSRLTRLLHHLLFYKKSAKSEAICLYSGFVLLSVTCILPGFQLLVVITKYKHRTHQFEQSRLSKTGSDAPEQNFQNKTPSGGTRLLLLNYNIRP